MPDLTSGGVWAYAGVFAALLLAGLGFPIPEELPVVTAGGLAAHAANQVPPQHPVWWIMLPICILGVVIGDCFLYSIGRYGGPHLLELSWVRKYFVSPEKRSEIETNFHKYGVKILLAARFLPGIRATIFVMAGILRMPVHRFLFADGIYAIPGVSLLFTLAYWFTDQVKEAVNNFEKKVDSARPFFVLTGLACVGLYMLFAYWKRRKATGNPHDIPLVGDIVAPDSIDEPSVQRLPPQPR